MFEGTQQLRDPRSLVFHNYICNSVTPLLGSSHVELLTQFSTPGMWLLLSSFSLCLASVYFHWKCKIFLIYKLEIFPTFPSSTRGRAPSCCQKYVEPRTYNNETQGYFICRHSDQNIISSSSGQNQHTILQARFMQTFKKSDEVNL